MSIVVPSDSSEHGTPPPVMTRAERLWRLKAEVKARSPYTCPHDGSGAIYPSFAPDRRRTWICTVCNREFTEAS